MKQEMIKVKITKDCRGYNLRKLTQFKAGDIVEIEKDLWGCFDSMKTAELYAAPKPKAASKSKKKSVEEQILEAMK